MKIKIPLRLFFIIVSVVCHVYAHAVTALDSGDSFFKVNDIERAIQSYQISLRDEPSQVEAKIGLAKCYYRKLQLVRVEKLVDEVLEVDALHGEALLLKGQLHIRNRELSKARKTFQSLIKAEPDNIDAHIGLKKVWHSLGDSESAKTMGERIRQLKK